MRDLSRRGVIGLLGGAAAWPRAALAQPIPVIGLLIAGTQETFAHLLAAFHKGLREAGFIEGQNVAIEYRWAEGDYDRLPALAADLVRRRVSAVGFGCRRSNAIFTRPTRGRDPRASTWGA
jgi:putative ABC transport system substrate-binding protein